VGYFRRLRQPQIFGRCGYSCVLTMLTGFLLPSLPNDVCEIPRQIHLGKVVNFSTSLWTTWMEHNFTFCLITLRTNRQKETG